MTKKDYELIADTISDSINYILLHDLKRDVAIKYIVECLQIALKKENSRFDSVKFLERLYKQEF